MPSTAHTIMAQLEIPVMRQAWKALSRGPIRLFRNNVGVGWQGMTSRVTRENLAKARASLRPGDLIISSPRPLHAGLDRGSGDLIGWRTMVITPDMVGRTIAQFVSAEAKRPRGGRLEPDQRTWRDLVNRAGGLAFQFVSEEEARRALEEDP